MGRRRLDAVRGAVLLACAAAFAVLSAEATSKLWDDYRDSPAWVFAAYGAVAGVLAVACLVLGVRSLRRR